MESVSSLKEAGEWLRTKALWLRGILLWATFKSVQATVAACFSFIIVAQAVVAGLLRLFGEPQSLLKVRAAQVASVNASLAADRHSRECAAKGGLKGPAAAFHVTAVAADPSTVKPVHVFVDPSKGECCIAVVISAAAAAGHGVGGCEGGLFKHSFSVGS